MMNMKNLFCLVFTLALFCQGIAQAQTLAIPFSLTQSSPSLVFSLDSYGILMSTGTENGTAVLSAGEQGAGTRLLWYPGKAAFRAGQVSGTQWDDANIGPYSVAFGYNTIASGSISIAMGSSSTASGGGSTAMGLGSIANNWGATAMGVESTASGSIATAMGGSTASGNSATAMGSSTASGSYATAAGLSTTAAAYDSFAAGRYNVGGGNATTWIATDPLFEIGMGTSSTNKLDALLVDKSGNVTATTFVTKAAAGDIPMYTGN